MEAIITIVGFLGSGKTTLLKKLVAAYTNDGWSPYVVLNDYENANLDAQQFSNQLDSKSLKALSGSCICCSGIVELRDTVNRIPMREKGITLIEANGTSDACKLMEFLGVGVKEHFLPPIQIAVVDIAYWQCRGEHNELEAVQVQVASMIVLTHLEEVSAERKQQVVEDIKRWNSVAIITTYEDVDIHTLPQLQANHSNPQKMDHLKAHWSSCSINLPVLPNRKCIEIIGEKIPSQILRVKGCGRIEGEDGFIYFERTPDGKMFIRPFNGEPITGAKLLTIGPGSDVQLLQKILKETLSLS